MAASRDVFKPIPRESKYFVDYNGGYDLVIKLNAKRSRRFDLSEVIFKCDILVSYDISQFTLHQRNFR